MLNTGRCGIVYLETKILGWEILLKSFIKYDLS